MNYIPLISTNHCSFNKEAKRLSLASELCGMPSALDVKSNITGKVVRFVVAQPGSRFFDEDGCDGEQQIYVPETPQRNVTHLVIYHQF